MEPGILILRHSSREAWGFFSRTFPSKSLWVFSSRSSGSRTMYVEGSAINQAPFGSLYLRHQPRVQKTSLVFVDLGSPVRGSGRRLGGLLMRSMSGKTPIQAPRTHSHNHVASVLRALVSPDGTSAYAAASNPTKFPPQPSPHPLSNTRKTTTTTIVTPACRRPFVFSTSHPLCPQLRMEPYGTCHAPACT
jgi:hypothetical protein